jgi:hypothetical protein
LLFVCLFVCLRYSYAPFFMCGFYLIHERAWSVYTRQRAFLMPCEAWLLLRILIITHSTFYSMLPFILIKFLIKFHKISYCIVSNVQKSI